jgi:transposase
MNPRQPYPSNLTEHEWAVMAPYIPQAKVRRRPEQYAKRDMLQGIF